MPELPEVETMRRGLQDALHGRIVEIDKWPCRHRAITIEPRIDRFRRRALERTIVDIGRLGKRVTLELDSGDTIFFEPRMTGLVLLADPPSREHLRLRIELAEAPVPTLWYWDRRGLGSVRLLDRESVARRFAADRLGPDALTIRGEVLRQRLRGSRRAIKVALLDQRALAGIGNLYAAEALHVAKLHPEKRCDRMSRVQWDVLAEAIREVLSEAVQYEGSTLGDGTYRTALNQAGNYQNHHRVYDRAGQPCPRCGASIRRIVQAQRSTFFCGRCQRR